MLQEQISQDLKAALLAKDVLQVSVLRSLKSAITYAEIARGIKGVSTLGESEVIDVLAKESKKRQESATLFTRGGAADRAAKEIEEKAIIDRYLPAALTREEINELVDKVIQEVGEVTPQTMGRIIGQVKQASKGAADGSIVAEVVKGRMEQ